MPLLLVNNAEDQTSGTTVTTSNAGGGSNTQPDEVVIGANMTLTFDNAHPLTGANAFKIALTSTATAITYLGWSATATGGAVRRLFLSFSFYSNKVPSTSSLRFVQFLNGSTVLGYLAVDVSGTGQCQFRSSGDVAIGSLSTALAVNTLYRMDVDVFFDGTLGNGKCRIYQPGTGYLAADAVFVNTAFGTSAGCDHVRLGCTTANFSSTAGDAFWFDDVSLSDQPQINLPNRIYIPMLAGTPVNAWNFKGTASPLLSQIISGTTFNQSLVATVTLTASFLKTVNKFLLATVTLVASFLKTVNKAMLATVTIQASITKTVNKALLATVTLTAAMVRVVNKFMLATVTITAAMVKSVGKSLLATVAITASMVRSVQKILQATVTLVASIIKQVNKFLLASVTLTGIMSAIKVIIVNMLATVSLSASMARSVAKSLQATVQLTQNAIQKTVSKAIGASLTASGGITKGVGHLMRASVSLSASMAHVFHAAGAVAKRYATIIIGRF